MQLHPLCTLFPRLTGYEFECLKSDIKENGLRTPITTYQGMVLDGGNRFAACTELGIRPMFEEFVGADISAFVLTSNLHRRHLTPGQQAALVACVQDWNKSQPEGRPKERCNVAPLSTSKDRATQSGASVRTQKTADKVAKEAPELAKQVARGEITLPKAAAQLAPKPLSEPEKPSISPEIEPEAPVYTELDELRDQVADLQDLLASGGSLESDAKQHISDMRKEIKTLRAELSAVKSMRDTLQNENAALKKQCMMQARKLKKYEGHGN